MLVAKDMAKGDSWRPRIYFIKILKNHFKLDKEDCKIFIQKYNQWSDYNVQKTNDYIDKIYGTGETAFSKVDTIIKKQTMRNLGLCTDNCKKCIYDEYKKEIELKIGKPESEIDRLLKKIKEFKK